MNCERTREYLPELIDGRLIAAVASDARAHLEGCAECRRELAELREILGLLDGLPTGKVPARIRAGAMKAIETEKRTLRAAAPSRWGVSPLRRFRWEALAAGVLFALGYFAGARHSAAPAADPETRRELAELHAKVDSVGKLVGYSLLQQRSANARLEAIADNAQPMADLVPPMLNDIPQLPKGIAFVRMLQPPPPDLNIADNNNLLTIPSTTGRWGGGVPVFNPSQLDQQPLPKAHAEPAYPSGMRRAGISGRVVVDFIVDVTGQVHNAFAASSSRPEFESAAVQAVSKWQFRPGRRDGRAVNTHLQVPVVFTLNAAE